MKISQKELSIKESAVRGEELSIADKGVSLDAVVRDFVTKNF